MLRALSRVPQRCGGWRATELFGSPLRSPGLELCRRSLCDAPSESRKRECTVDDVVQWLHAERAEDVRALDVRGLLGGAIGDALIFASGRSKAHMFRLAQAVRQEFKDRNVIRYGHPPMIEGKVRRAVCGPTCPRGRYNQRVGLAADRPAPPSTLGAALG